MQVRKGQHYRHLPAFILLTLAEGRAHGGAIHTTLTESLPLFEADTGAVYRTLQRLEKEGAVVFDWDTTGSGPARKVFSITTAGWNQLEQWKYDIELRLANLTYFLRTYNSIKNNSLKGEH